jgi:hypothetical protein
LAPHRSMTVVDHPGPGEEPAVSRASGVFGVGLSPLIRYRDGVAHSIPGWRRSTPSAISSTSGTRSPASTRRTSLRHCASLRGCLATEIRLSGSVFARTERVIVEHLWSRADATGGKALRTRARPTPPSYLLSSANTFPHLPRMLHGKGGRRFESVRGLFLGEEPPANGRFFVASPDTVKHLPRREGLSSRGADASVGVRPG